jgi:hypothetical protein
VVSEVASIFAAERLRGHLVSVVDVRAAQYLIAEHDGINRRCPAPCRLNRLL